MSDLPPLPNLTGADNEKQAAVATDEIIKNTFIQIEQIFLKDTTSLDTLETIRKYCINCLNNTDKFIVTKGGKASKRYSVSENQGRGSVDDDDSGEPIREIDPGARKIEDMFEDEDSSTYSSDEEDRPLT
eukprot:UN03403